ncbi:MAG: AAA family ATPase [Epulopiscium sp. Nele67-Bin004]|nr:MAG: AAA family ATPase [Epulopiscium sp. Nele67-Bin004]
MYINSTIGYKRFLAIVEDDLYIDKSMIIENLNKRVNKSRRWVCITRPRRFGKSVMTTLIESYYSKAIDSKEVFDNFKIASCKSYEKHLNMYNVIKIDFSSLDTRKLTFDEYLDVIELEIGKQLDDIFPTDKVLQATNLSSKLTATGKEFIFIFDEWDFIFNQNIYTDNHEDFLNYLRVLLKDREYVALCYMTGILPIKKYSTGSALNMFEEYTFLNDVIFGEFFGFTEDEVKSLCGIEYEKIAEWYNGYITQKGIKLFNPRSVKIAIEDNYCQSYWTNTGEMNEVANYLRLDCCGVREDVIKMLDGKAIDISITEDFRAGSPTPSSKQEIYSAMVTLGFLSYSEYKLRIPNKELMIEFEKAIKHEDFGELATVIKNADNMLYATLERDTAKMAEIVHDIHNLEIPVLKYNDENSLSCVLTLAYLSARDRYRIEREEKSGKGYVDFVFHPRNSIDLPIIVELKKDKSTEVALEQIVEREYVAKFQNLYKRNVLIVGINYDMISKEHSCDMIEVRC